MDMANLALGDFGDERLAKRGGFCFLTWSPGRAFAFGVWPAGDAAELLVFRGFWPTRG